MAERTKPHIQVHPFLASSEQPASTILITGYVGQASREGQVRLYHSLEDISHYIEFDQSAVVQTTPAPEALAPNQGVSMWVKASTSVRWTREFKRIRQLAIAITKYGACYGEYRGSYGGWYGEYRGS